MSEETTARRSGDRNETQPVGVDDFVEVGKSFASFEEFERKLKEDKRKKFVEF